MPALVWNAVAGFVSPLIPHQRASAVRRGVLANICSTRRGGLLCFFTLPTTSWSPPLHRRGIIGTICHQGVAPATRSFNAGCHPEGVKSQRTQCCDLTTRGDPGLLKCATLSHRFFIAWIATSSFFTSYALRKCEKLRSQ